MSPRAGLDIWENKNLLLQPGFELRIVQPMTKSLYRFTYPFLVSEDIGFRFSLRGKHFFSPPSRLALGPNQFPVSCVYCVFHWGRI